MSRDPFEMLAGMVPRSDAVLAPGDDHDADALLERIVTLDHDAVDRMEPDRERIQRFRHRRRAVLAVTVATAVLASGGAVAALILLQRPSDPVTLVCYSEPSTDPEIKVGLSMDPERTAVQQCASLWSDGTFGTAGAKELIACVADFEVTVVVPGESAYICATLGWKPAGPPLPDEQLDQRVTAKVPELFEGCIADLEVARDQVERLLVDLDANGSWTVLVEGSTSPDRPCAANVIDATSRVVRIIAFQPPPG